MNDRSVGTNDTNGVSIGRRLPGRLAGTIDLRCGFICREVVLSAVSGVFFISALAHGAEKRVHLDEFDLSCPASVNEGGTAACTLKYSGTEAKNWPVAGILHLSSDANRALVRGSPLDLQLATPDPSSEIDGGLWWIGSVLIAYSRFDWEGEASTQASRTVYITIQDDDDYEGEEVFYVSLAASGSRGVGFLYTNRQAITISASDSKSSDAQLQELAIMTDAGEVPLNFAAGTISYAATVAYRATEAVVTPVANHKRATITVNGTRVESGEASRAVSLGMDGTTIDVVVTAENGTTRTYRIVVTRQPRPENVQLEAEGFTLVCPSTVTEGASISCTLANTRVPAAEWPVVAIIHSSGDGDARALIEEDPLIPNSSPAFGVDLSLSETQTPARENYKHGYGELFSGGSTSVYTTYGYQKFDWAGQGASSAERSVIIQTMADDEVESAEIFYIAVAPSGYTGLSRLIDNKAPIIIERKDTTPETPETTPPAVMSITSSATHPTKDGFTVTITFSEPVMGLTDNEIEVTNGTGSNFAGAGAVYTLDIAPNAGIEDEVTVTVPAGAVVDGVNNGNLEASAAFSVDTKAPMVSTVAITSNPGPDATYAAEDEIRVTVTFSETVEVTGTPQLSLELGEGRPTADYESGSGTAALVFAYEVAGGESDTDGVGVEAGSLSGGTIRDGPGNNAVLDHDRLAADAGHKVDAVKPQLAATGGAVADGTTLTLAYDEPLDGSSAPVPGGFTVTGGDQARTVFDAAVSGSAVALTLDPAVEHGEAGIQVSYTPGANPIRDVAGNDAEALTDQEVENKTVDTKAPVLEGIEISSDPGEDETYAAGEAIAVRVRFSETVTVDTTDGTPTLNLTVGGQSKPGRYRPGPDSAAVVFVYRVESGDIDTDGVSIAAARIELNGGTIQDLADNPAALAYEAVAADSGHKVDGVKPVLQGATVHAARLVLIYHEALDEDSTPSKFDFTVMVAGSARTVTQVLVSGSGVTLTLASPVAAGEAVTVSYTPGFNPIQDPVGNVAEGLTDEPALPPLVTISAQDDPASVTEGTAADFTLTREPPTTTALTVGISITERGSVIETEGSYEPPEEVTFTAGDARAILMVLTDDDDQQEEDGSVIATLQPGAGYRLGEVLTQTAEVTITDDDGAPIPPGGGGGGGGGGSGGVRQTVPDAPRNLRADGTDEAVTLSWDAPENDDGFAITDYEYRINGAGRGWTSIGSTHTTHTVTGLVNGRVYVFRVRAVNAAGSSPYSNRAEATPGVEALDFAHFANGADITSDLVFVNVATHPIRPVLYFYDQEGQPIDPESVVDLTGDLEVMEDGALSIQMEMEPLGELTISTHGQGVVVSGSVRVVSDGPIGGVLRFDLPGIGVAGVRASQPVRDVIFPARRRGGLSTAVAIRNLGKEALGVSCRLMSGGIVLEEAEISLEANGQEARYIEEVFPRTDTSDFVGSVRCTAPGEGMFTGVAVELDAGNRIFTTLPVVPVNLRGRGREAVLDFAHFANGEGITSDLVFVNVETQPSGPATTPFHVAISPIRPALYFYDKEGNPIAAESVVEITGDLEVRADGGLSVRTEMEPLGELTISTHGRGEVVAGSVTVASEGPIGGVLRFDLPGIGVAGVGASQPIRDAIFPARRQAGGISTAAAIHNPGEEAMAVSCQLIKDGAVLEEEEIPLEANGQEARFIEEMFTTTDTSDFVGSVRCTAPGRFTGVAVELDAANRIFTTLPMVPVPERMSQE